MYFHEVEAALKGGKKIRRASMPKGHGVVKVEEGPIELSDEEKKSFGLKDNAVVKVAETLVYCEGTEKATYAHALTQADLSAQDWEEA